MYQPLWQSASLIFGHQDQAVKRTLCILLISRICPQKHDCGSNGREFVISRQNCHASSLRQCRSALLTPGEEALLPLEPHPQAGCAVKVQDLAGSVRNGTCISYVSPVYFHLWCAVQHRVKSLGQQAGGRSLSACRYDLGPDMSTDPAGFVILVSKTEQK